MITFPKSNLLSFFVKHKTAANIIMFLMLLVGILSINKLNRQFFPNFDVETISVSIEWPGATAEEVDNNIIQLLEPEIRPISGIKKVVSKSVEGLGYSIIEFNFGTNMQKAMSDVENAISRMDFPEETKKPKITKVEFYDVVTRIVISGQLNLSELRKEAKKFKEILLNAGVDKVDLVGLPVEEILIEIPQSEITKFKLSLNEISRLISLQSKDVPGGNFAEGSLRIRTLGDKRLLENFQNLEIKNFSNGGKIILKDISKIRETYEDASILQFLNGKPAVEITVRRSKTSDALTTAKIVDQELKKYRELKSNLLEITTYNTASNLIKERINLLVKNGISGLIIVLIVLFIFLAWKTAIWVALGIPIAFLATFGVMYFSGQSINMISLFGLIMALGIVVDDAIVVGEHSNYLRETRNLNYNDAPIVAATRMSAPVICAMLTTVGAFLPLFLIKGIIGQIIIAIPLVICAVLIASLIECFLVLPAHLAHFDKGKSSHGKFRKWFDKSFKNFQENSFNKIINFCYDYRYLTMVTVFGLFFISISMMKSNRVQFSFFPTPESDLIIANFDMLPGSKKNQTYEMLNSLEKGLQKTKLIFKDHPELVRFSMTNFGKSTSFETDQTTNKKGNFLKGSMVIELITADKRNVRTNEFINVWKENIKNVSGLNKLIIRAPRGGPPGRDVDVRLKGNDLEVLKTASKDLLDLVNTIPGVSSVSDNFEVGIQERVVVLNNRGKALGFSVSEIGSQIRTAINGKIVTTFPRGDEEVMVRVKLDENDTKQGNLGNLRLISPNNDVVMLGEIASISNKIPFSSISRQDGFREVTISGDLNNTIINTSQARNFLLNNGLIEIANKYNLDYRFAGRDLEQKETFSDMFIGSIVGLVIIYIVLTWIFKSWLRPITIMIMIPLSFIGAVFGHYFLNLTMSILSMFALLALAGIVVNNSIILVSTIERRLDELLQDKKNKIDIFKQAVISGVTNRLRPVLLTSLTTIGGLSALMFEKSLQAQFLIPMAATIVFGLGVTAILVLIVIPSMMGIGKDLSLIIKNFKFNQIKE